MSGGGMGSVERVLVLGIVVVIVAILGITIWGAAGDDAGTVVQTAADGGVVPGGPATPGVAMPFADPAVVDAGAAGTAAAAPVRKGLQRGRVAG